MKACVWDGAGAFVIDEVAEPVERAGWVTLDVVSVGICGTDLHLRQGHHSRAVAGAVPGHEILGRLTREVGALPRGARVFANPFVTCGTCEQCRVRATPQLCASLRLVGADFPGALAARVAVPESGIVAIPNALSDTAAGIVEPVAVVARAVRRGGIEPGQSVLVIGGGPIGYLIALISRGSGAASVVVAEPAPERRRLVSDKGIATIASAVDTEPADVVFDASGHPAVTAVLGRVTKIGGVVVLVATQSKDAAFDLSRLPFGELSLIGSGGYGAIDIKRAIALLGSGIGEQLTGVVTATVPLDEVPEAMDRLESGGDLKILVVP